MAGVRATVNLRIDAKQTGANDLGTPNLSVTLEELLAFDPGTDAIGKADTMFSDRRTIAASGNDDLDLTGALANAFGATIAQAEIVLIYVKAAAANANNVVIGNAAAADFVGPFSADGTYTLKPGEFGLFVSKTGWAVAAGTADVLRITNSAAGTAVTYDILILGRTVAA